MRISILSSVVMLMGGVSASMLLGSYAAFHSTSTATVAAFAAIGLPIGILLTLVLTKAARLTGLKYYSFKVCIPCGLVLLSGAWSSILAMRVWAPQQRFVQVAGVLPPGEVLLAEGGALPLDEEKWGFVLKCATTDIRRFSNEYLSDSEVFGKWEDVPSFYRRLAPSLGLRNHEASERLFAIAGSRGPYVFCFLSLNDSAPAQLVVFRQCIFKVGD